MTTLKQDRKLRAYDVYLHGLHIDTLFYNTPETIEDVKRSLVNHDGYNSAIVVRVRK